VKEKKEMVRLLKKRAREEESEEREKAGITGKKRACLTVHEVTAQPPDFSFPVVELDYSLDTDSLNPYAAKVNKYYRQQILERTSTGLTYSPSGYVSPPYYPTNFVCTYNIDLNLENVPAGTPVKIDFKTLTGYVPAVGFNPQNFAASIWRCLCSNTGNYKGPKGTVLMFISGKMVCTGTESKQEGQIVAELATKMLREQSNMPKLARATVRDFVTQNVAATAYAGFPIVLKPLSIEWSMKMGCSVNYDGSLFPGLIFRLPVPILYDIMPGCLTRPKFADAAARQKWEKRKIVFLVFRLGSTVITGAKNEDETATAWAWFHRNVLVDYKDTVCPIEKSSEYKQSTAPADQLSSSVVKSAVNLATMLAKFNLEGCKGFEDWGKIAVGCGDLPDDRYVTPGMFNALARYVR
jgi:transcription initiation factor TFIID TATA-box-binding protein